MRTHNIKTTSSQRGSALLVSLVFLVILTILGLSVMNTSHLEMKMAANAQFGNQAFQSAESAIDTVMRIPKDTLLAVPPKTTIERNYFFNETTAGGFVNGTQFFAERADTALTNIDKCGNGPNSSVGSDVGSDAHHYTIRSTGQSQRAGRSEHWQGIYVLGPPCKDDEDDEEDE